MQRLLCRKICASLSKALLKRLNRSTKFDATVLSKGSKKNFLILNSSKTFIASEFRKIAKPGTQKVFKKQKASKTRIKFVCGGFVAARIKKCAIIEMNNFKHYT